MLLVHRAAGRGLAAAGAAGRRPGPGAGGRGARSTPPRWRDNIRDIEKALNIPDLIAEGTVSYGMQTFDQSLMKWYKDGMISYESALFYSTNPSEFALRVSGVDSASDRKFTEISGDPSAARAMDLTP